MAPGMAVEHGGRTARTVGRVLIHIALLSTTSGWQLPSNDEEAGHLIFRALVLIGAATTFCAAFTPHMTRPSAASKWAVTDQPDVCPPHWLPVLLAACPSHIDNPRAPWFDEEAPPFEDDNELLSMKRRMSETEPGCADADTVWACVSACHRKHRLREPEHSQCRAKCPTHCPPPTPSPPSPSPPPSPPCLSWPEKWACDDKCQADCKTNECRKQCKSNCVKCDVCEDKNKRDDPDFCQNELPDLASKVLKCKDGPALGDTLCQASCGFCFSPPSPPPSPPSPPSPPLPPASPPSPPTPPPPPPPPASPACLDEDPGFCAAELPTFVEKLALCKEDPYTTMCRKTCLVCT